ncbi:histone-lysine N-methyltransferase 2C-like isoform X4 [Melanotaenia boesemani]|uniref:histone-lysine N-methyltransferase 2C-like isoform X4 n=1 Tax=Melanotaenia boesemani TaxID=1250792 RepID=UPI001C046DAE|nr:histone-lysine N-methyltransferase 2C-like isoform X4 [Melanotaenia boesemani]
MPSEAQTQEPRDRGPAPPVTRAGRSAQLAKAAATSPALERRPRGRPRKDGSNGRSAPPTPPPPLPSPPPPPKPRKKGRSRGRAQVDDEESMDATEKNNPDKTETREVKDTREVKPSGRRRSTSRRKSNTNPEPSPDKLSPHPSPDPDPDPLQPDPISPKCSPEPAPGPEEEDRPSPSPASPLQAPSPGGDPHVSPLPPSPDLILAHKPDSDPVEEDRPSLSQSPSHIEVACSPSRVTRETDEGEASPMEQSPDASPRSSPSVSPCLRLEDEDEDSLSPLFQRSLSEDSGGSPTPILEHTKKRVKQCAFCYRGDHPPLGQGRLVVFGPTPGYIPLHILNRRTSSDRDSDCHDHCYRGNQAPPTCSSPEQCDEESSSEFIKQLGPIGLPHDINVQLLFDPTGQCCAHLQCAAWSEEVHRGEGQSLLYVDKAIDAGSTQVCVFCQHLGASLRCQVTGCGRSYHFPCAAAAGAHQDWKQRLTLCTRHTHTDSSQCVLCSGGGEPSGLLMCCCCGNCYHGSCLDPPLNPSPLCRAGWQCPQCRVCCSCRLRGDERVLLVCERCDKAYHTHCLTPPLEQTPSSDWTCKNCRVCLRCDVRASGQWANHPFLCESCDSALPCPLCGHVPDLNKPQEYFTCTCCYRCVHVDCSVQAGEVRAGSEGYVCSICRPQEVELIQQSPSPSPPTSISQMQVPGHTEAPPISHITHSPVQLTPSQPGPTEIQHSPAPSPSDLQQGLASSIQDLQHSPAPSPSNLQQGLPSSIEDLQHSPAPSPSDLQEGLVSSIKDLQHSLTLSPSNQHSSPPSPKEISQSTPPEDTQHILEPSVKELHQDSVPFVEDLQSSITAAPTDLQPSPAPSPKDTNQNPVPSCEEIHDSNTPSPGMIHQSPEPSPKDTNQSPAPSTKETHLSPEPPTEEIHQSPAPSPNKAHQSPVPPLEEIHQSPASSPNETHQSPEPPPEEIHQSPAPSPNETHQSPEPPPEEIHQSPPTSPKETHPSPRPSPKKTHQSPSSPCEEIHQNTVPSPEEINQSSLPSQKYDHQTSEPSPKETHLNPEPPCKEDHHSPAPCLEEIHQSPPPNLGEMHQSLEPPCKEDHHSPAPCPEEIHQSPASNLGEMHQSPEPPCKEVHHSSAPCPVEIHQSPVPSPKMIHKNPGPTSEVIHQSSAPFLKDAHQTLEPPLIETPQHPEASCEEVHHSPAPSLREAHQSSTSSPQEVHKTSPPAPKETNQSPAPTCKEIHHSTTPSPEEIHQSPVPSPKEIHQSPAPPEENHQSPVPSPKEIHQSPTTPPEEIHQRPVPSPKEIHQSPTPPPEEIHQSPAPSPKEIHQSPTPPPEEIHQSPAPSPKEIHQSPTPSPKEIHQSPAPSPGEINQIFAPSPKETHPSPLPSPTILQQHPPPSSEGIQTSLKPSLSNLPEISEPSAKEIFCSPQRPDAEPAEYKKSLTQSPSIPKEDQDSSLPFHSDPMDFGASTSPSCPDHAALQERPSSPHLYSAECQKRGPTSYLSPEKLQEGHTQSESGPREVELSPGWGSPASSILAYPPPQSLIHQGLSPPSVHPGPRPDDSPHSPEQDDETQNNTLCSPSNITISQPHHTSSQGQFCPTPSSPAQVDVSSHMSPTQEAEPTLDQENPDSSPVQDISTLDQNLLPVCCRSLMTATSHATLRPSSAPCSPSASSVRPRPRSLSQPGSPVQPHSTEKSPHPDSQTLERSSTVLSAESNPNFPTPSHVRALQTPVSLDHFSTSVEHSSLTGGGPPPAHDSPSLCTEAMEAANLLPTTVLPATCLNSCEGSTPLESDAAETGHLTQPVSPLAPSLGCNTEPELAQPTQTISCQDEEIEGHLSSEPETSSSPVLTEAISVSDHQERTSNPSELTEPQISPTQLHSSCHPSQTSPASGTSSPPHCSLTHTGSAGIILVSSDHDNQVSPHYVGVTLSPPRSSPAGQASPVHSVHSGSIQTQTTSDHSLADVSPPHSPALAGEMQHSPPDSPHHPNHNTEASTAITGVQLSPTSGPDLILAVNPLIETSIPPSVAHLDSSLVKPAKPDHSSIVSPNPAGSESAVSLTHSHLRPNSPAQTVPSHPSIVCSGPAQDDITMPNAALTKEMPACPLSPALSQVSPSQTASISSSHTQDPSVDISPDASPVSGQVDSVSPGPTSPVSLGLGPPSPAHPQLGPGLDSLSCMLCGDSPGEGAASPVPATLRESEASVSSSPNSPAQLGPGSGSPQLQTETEVESAAAVDVTAAEEQRDVYEEQKENREALHQQKQEEEEEEEEHPHQKVTDNQDDVEPAGTAKGEDQEEEDGTRLRIVPVCSPSGVQLMGDQQSAASPLLPQQTPPTSHHPPSPPCASPPASPFTSPQSPPSSPPAGSLEASSSSCSPSHKTALPSSPPRTTPPSTENLPQDEESTSVGEEEAGMEDKTLLCNDNQSQNQFEPVAMTLPTKDEHQSRTEPSDKEELQQPMNEKEEPEEEEEPVSPVLDLDPSLDMEVMELMTSSLPPSLLHLSSPSPPLPSRRGKGQSLRPPPFSSRPSDDLSIRLRQSPFSTEASPETSPARIPITPPPLTPPSPPYKSSPPSRESPPLSKVPPTMLFPFTPKIGMGKPAISKRKFSSGRARGKQGSWWSSRRALSPPSSSQDSMGEGGWDSPKPHPPDSPLWSMRVGRGSGFPGRRRSRGGGIGGGRGGRGRSRLKTQDSLIVAPGCEYVEAFQIKEEEENSMHNTVVMFSTLDHFTLRQDMCVVCGSFGQGAEGRLLACSQCGQCYHPYCVNIKITRVVLTKGWRCLECTVCEACGEASDPGRLLLCDDCDISYHTYCLDPPLHTVPKGAWKCKWCVWCVKCGSTSPGLHCDWQSNFSLCGPCSSLSRCPVCQRTYSQDDLILQCQQCDRWVHAVCQGLTTEEEVEVAADEGFDCSLCRTHGRSSYGSSEALAPYMPPIISRIREPDTKTYTQDGVCLTESGLSHLQSLVEPLTSPRKYRRCKPKLKLRIINQNRVSVLQTPEPDLPTEQDHSRGELGCDMKSDSSPERDHTHNDDASKEPDITDGNKKRKRKPYRPGIGGFMVRQRGGKAGLSRIKLCRKDSTEPLQGQDEGVMDADVAMEMPPDASQATEKVKKRYRKKKTKLEEAFPLYLQDAFFGRDLLERSRQVDWRVGPEASGSSQSTMVERKAPAHVVHGPSPTGLLVATNKKQRILSMSEDALMDLSDVLNTDPHILATGHTGQFQVERSLSPFAGLDISPVTNDPALSSEAGGSSGRGQRTTQDEPLDAILSPELDKMVSDGAILSKLYKIPELEGKDVEEVFTAVLSPDSNSQPELSQHTHSAAGTKAHTHTTAVAAFPRLPLMNGLMPAAPHFPNAPMMPSGAQGQAGFRMPTPEGPVAAPVQGPIPGSASASQALAGEGEQDALSTAQRSMLKWEKEESLGEMATVAPVLYCNTNFPQLKLQYPDWPTRVKQIAKLWRKASSQDRAPYVQKARDNRAAQRINKVQLSNDPLKRLQPPQQPQPLGPYDPVSMETEMAFKDPLRPRESEQEQEWKLRQVSQMRQKSKQLAKIEATQKLEQVKNEQRQQQLMSSQRLSECLSPDAGSRSPLTPTQQPVPGGDISPLHSASSRQNPQMQGSSGLGPPDDVFLRPQAPPPSGFSSLPHSPQTSSPLHQPPSSPQMFSPPSSRPSSPWDPCNKKAGTPRPTSSQSGGAPATQQLSRGSLSASPAHDVFGSPAPSPDSNTSDAPRAPTAQPGLQQSRAGMMSPSSGSAPDLSVRHVGMRTAETTQRMNIRGDLIQGVIFKAPMPPQHQAQQEVFGSLGGGRRDPPIPTDLGFTISQTQEPIFPSSPLSGLGSPHRSPYAQNPGTPRPDYSQQTSDHFSQQSPLSSRPSPDPYSNPQTPGTPRPHSDPTYLTTPPALRLDQYKQQPANRRPSPSHPPLDPYSSSPGTPRPSERFPRSPGNQRSTDPYSQPVGTPRPSPDPYIQQPSTPRPQKTHESFSQAPMESFSTQPAACGSSPLTSGPSTELGSFPPTPHQIQQSPVRQQQQDQFPRTPSSQTPKHPGISEEGGFSSLSCHAPGQDPFEPGHMTPSSTQTDKMPANEISALSVASLDGPMSVLPQLGDTEEKLRQRQRLRQLILRQQQQKSALRQEKGLQEAASAPALPLTAGSTTPLHSWAQEDSNSAAPPADLFGRPPPPYPGTVRPPAPRFPGGFSGEQQRGFTPGEAPFPRQSLPRELGVRGPGLRFSVPPGAPAGLPESFLRPPQGTLPEPGLNVVEGNPVVMRRPMPTEFTGIRPVMAPNPNIHVMAGVPQPFLPHSVPVQQHNTMPYIELRHRAPESRLRLPFTITMTPDPRTPLLHTRDPQSILVRPSPARMGETVLGQQMVMGGGVVHQLNQPDQQHLGHTVLTQSSEAALPGPDGMEEHLEGEDSAVKDLEDVEVKDLVDLNLNLDPEDGKEDLDLGPNDLHLDDFLPSGKFDLIAYADPEFNLEDKKDMFNEELDLGEPVEEKEGAERRKSDSHLLEQVKQEVKDAVKMDGGPSVSQHPAALGAPGAEAAASSALLIKEKLEDSGSVSGTVAAVQARDQVPSTGQQSVFQQRPFGPSSSPALPSPLPQGLPVSPHPTLTPQVPPTLPHQLPPQPRLLLNPQSQTPHPGTSTQSQVQNQNKSRPLLLEEQPLLLQDLLDQERQEQQQQKQMQALIRQSSTPETVFPDTDFDSISDPIMKAKMVALKGINKVMSQGNLGLNPMVINRFQQPPGAPVVPGTPAAPGAPVAPGPEVTPQPPHLVGQDGKLNPQLVRRNPPSFGPGFINESQRRQYEEWLGETQQLLQMQQRLLEDQIAAHRKTKKALSAKQRTAKRAGRTFAEEDAAQLRYISEQQGVVQKQLEQIRKQQKDHTELIEDYRSKQQRVMQLPNPPIITAPAPTTPQNPHPQPLVPLQPPPAGPTPAHVPNVPAGWISGPRAPGLMGQRMPPHLQPPMLPSLPNNPQGPPHTQTPPTMVPALTAPTAGFTSGPQGPAGGPKGATGNGVTPAPQVKFDDNNPFSEGFQERERRERLREQQERQRVQLMQEVERHRALQQRLELEQQDLLGASMGPRPAAQVAQKPVPGSGGPAGSAPVPSGESLSQMPFYSSEPRPDFLQSPLALRPPPQHPGQAGAPFPPQAALHQGFVGGPLHSGGHPALGLLPGTTAERGRAPPNLQTRPRLPSPAGPPAQGQVRPAGVGVPGMTPSHPGGQAHRLGHDSSSSSPSTPLPPSFSSSGGPASLIQLYSDIIPDDKTKKRRSRKKDGDDAAGGPRTPLSQHSDDITAPPTPAVSDTSCSTPTHQPDMSFSALAPSSELERQLSVSSAAHQRSSILGLEGHRGPLSATHLEVKVEHEEMGACERSMVKMEESGGDGFSSPLQGGDGGKELLRHLLKDKTSSATTPSPTRQAPLTAQRQLSNDSIRSDEDGPGFHGNMVTRDSSGSDLLEPSGKKKTQRCKRPTQSDKEKAPPKYKRRKKDEEEKPLHTSTEPLMTHLRQLSVLPLMEPVLRVDLSLFPPYGSSSLGRDSRLSGSFGNACLDGVTDYYSQLIYKQNNLSNPPTPPASLPPTPPPVARQKLVNGFATTDELTRKDLSEQEVEGVSALKQKEEELLALSHASKTVDVPASLPTPPHNNQEELRVQGSSEPDSPDGFVPSSSPESVADMEVSRYPDLSFIKLEPPSPCPSPTFPIMPSAWGKGSAVKQEVKAEPSHQGPPACSNTDLVTIAITLNPVAAQNVPGVMAAMAALLRVPVPIHYQLSQTAGPVQSSLDLLAGVRVTQGSADGRQQRPPLAAGNKPQCCSHCKGMLGNRVHVIREFKQEGPSRPGASLVFCSPNCSTLFTSDQQKRSAGGKPAVPALLSGFEQTPPSSAQHQYTNNMSSITVHSLPNTSFSSSSSSPPLSFPPASAITMEIRPRMDSLKVKVKLKPRPRAMPGDEESLSSRHGKRVKSSRWRRWNVSITFSRGPCIPNEAVAMPTEEEVDVILKKLGTCLRPDPLPKDLRRCCFCHQQGDGPTDGPARLLNLDLDLWVHLNCALWSSEVYETQAGALINVELALRRGLTLRCAHCQQTGATSGCNRLRCTNTYHFTCALQAHCTFFKDKTMLCHLHKPRTVPLSGDRSSSCSPSSTPGLTPDSVAVCSDPYDSELRCFAVFRRVFVQRDEARQIAAVVQRGERQHTFRVGSLLFRAVGRLLPQQMSNFHNKTAIFPVGYHANRIYWSMRHNNKRCKYMCYIEEEESQPLFKVKVVEKGHEDLILTGPTPKAVWDQILEPITQIRSSSGTLKLFPIYLKGEDLFGLTTSAVTRIIESLPGVEACERYTFRYGRNPLMEWPLAFNPSGSARSEPKACQAKRPYLLTSIAPRCQGSVGSIVGLVPGVVSLSPGEAVAGAHQGRHSKSSQYRRMKAEWKSNVYLARSRIQGLGLYAARDIEKCTMVIEYIGTIIRSEVANRKERLYESQNRGVYMFRIDNDYVIDATITGGPARYINHSCAPNCITEVVTVEKENKIIISSCRRIQRGEELCYDYKFDLEDDQHKIPCHCGAVNCRKWMN